MPHLIIIDVTPTLVDRTTGTNIGNMTLNGGLAAAFDGVTNAAAGSCASFSDAGYCGKTYGTGKVVYSVQVHGSNDFGYTTGGAVSVAISLFGKNGTPANATDGTLIGAISFTNLSNESAPRAIISTDNANAYTSIWVQIDPALTFNSLLAELAITELL